MAGLVRYSIQNLNPHLTNVQVVGQLIAKSDVNLFHRSGNKYSNQNHRNSNVASNHQPPATSTSTEIDADGGSLHGVLTLTVRDSDRGIINCTVWGRESVVQSYAVRFHLGDVLSVQHPTIEVCKSFDAYHPLTPSPYRLTVNDGRGEACVIASMVTDEPQLDRMLSMPVKSTSAALRLADVGGGIALDSLAGGTRTERFVDLLVVVQKMGPVKSLGAGKFGKGERMMRNVDVMDESASAVRLTIWNTGFVKRSHAWTEMITVLQLIDVRIAPSAFRRCMELYTHGRTLIVEAARTRDVYRLQQFARTAPPLIAVDRWNAPAIDLTAIRTVMSVAQVLEHAANEFHVLMFVVISSFDLDGGDANVVVRRCAYCQRLLRNANLQCANEDCVLMGTVTKQATSAATTTAERPARNFDIRVELTDHSGTMACRLRSVAAQRLLGCTPDDWLRLSDRQHGQIKWRWLLERCAVKVCVQRDTNADGERFNCAELVDCELADDERVTREIEFY